MKVTVIILNCVFFFVLFQSANAALASDVWKALAVGGRIPKGKFAGWLREHNYKDYCNKETPEDAERRIGDENGIILAYWNMMVGSGFTEPVNMCIVNAT